MDVRDLGNAMLAVGGLFDAANKRLNGDKATIQIRVQAMEPSSFDITFDVAQQLTGASAVLGSDFQEFFTNAVTIKALIFGGSGAGAAGVITSLVKLVKAIHGRKVKTKRLRDNRIEVTIENAEHVEIYNVTTEGWNLFDDGFTRRQLHEVVRPLSSPGIDLLVASEHGTDLDVVTEDDVAAFIPDGDKESVLDETRKMTFTIGQLRFLKGGKWQLTDGSTRYQVTIRDEVFLRRVDRNELRFGKEDLLHCDLRIIQTTVNGRLKTDYEVYNINHEAQEQSSF